MSEPVEIKFTPPKKWLASEIDNNYRGIRWVTKYGVHGVPTKDDVINYLGYKDFIRDLTDEEILEKAINIFGVQRFEMLDDVYWTSFAREIIKASRGEK